MTADDATSQKVGARLAMVREVLGLSQTEMATRAGIAVNAWNKRNS